MNKYAKFTMVMIIGAFPLSALSGSTVPGEITKLEYLSSGVVLATTNGSREQSEVPSCVSSSREYRWAINGLSEGGKVQVSGMVAAYHAGKKVRIIGTDGCDAFGDSEEISFFQVTN